MLKPALLFRDIRNIKHLPRGDGRPSQIILLLLLLHLTKSHLHSEVPLLDCSFFGPDFFECFGAGFRLLQDNDHSLQFLGLLLRTEHLLDTFCNGVQDGFFLFYEEFGDSKLRYRDLYFLTFII